MLSFSGKNKNFEAMKISSRPSNNFQGGPKSAQDDRVFAQQNEFWSLLPFFFPYTHLC